MNLKEKLQKKAEDLLAKRQALKAAGEGDDLGLIKSLTGEVTGLFAEVEELKAAVDALAENEKGMETLTAPAPFELANSRRPTEKALLLAPASGQNHFKRDTVQEGLKAAYDFGMWFLGGVVGNQKAAQYCQKNGIQLKAHTEGTNETGGFLVPDQFMTDLIVLREQYGVFRRYARVVPMASESVLRPRRKTGLTYYWVGESQTITESTKNWDRVRLTAKKLGVLAKISSELSEDSVIDLANDVIDEIAYQFSLAEDEAGFNGDGTSAYGGIVGVREKLKGLSATIADIAGLVVGAGNAYSELTRANFRSVVGKLPAYADGMGARWFVHKTFYEEVMQALAESTSGTTATEIREGNRTPIFMGYPVVFSQVMPKVEANSQVCAVLGDLRFAAMLGDRRQIAVAVSEHANFETDELTLRGTQRIDINVHDVGNASSTASARVPGPVVGLITAAS